MSQNEHDQRIDYIEFPVTDVAVARRFYSSVFGWEKRHSQVVPSWSSMPPTWRRSPRRSGPPAVRSRSRHTIFPAGAASTSATHVGTSWRCGRTRSPAAEGVGSCLASAWLYSGSSRCSALPAPCTAKRLRDGPQPPGDPARSPRALSAQRGLPASLLVQVVALYRPELMIEIAGGGSAGQHGGPPMIWGVWHGWTTQLAPRAIFPDGPDSSWAGILCSVRRRNTAG
jgi:hypothetical protein